MDEKKLLKLYQKLVNDSQFDKLDLELKRPNIFEIMGVEHREIKHSNFLAWLLNPAGSHKLGNIFILKLLRDILLFDEKISALKIEGLNYRDVTILREYKNIDILIILPTDKICVCIENKIWTSDHSNQLEKYKLIVEKEYPDYNNYYIYLTPFGDLPNDISSGYSIYSYAQISEQIGTILDIYNEEISENIKNYLSDYHLILKRKIMNNDTTNLMAQKIYNNHKELFDFIIEQKGSEMINVKIFIQEYLEKNGYVIGTFGKNYVRFTTKELDSILKKGGRITGGWSGREIFLFEVVLYDPITFQAVVGPVESEFQSLKNTLRQVLIDYKGIKTRARTDNGWDVIKYESGFSSFDLIDLEDSTTKNLVIHSLEDFLVHVKNLEKLIINIIK